MPYFLSAIQSSIGIGWKAGIAAEVLTVPALSIGKMIFESKMYMETVDLFAWTLVVIVISLVIETVLLKTLKQISKKYNGEVK
jgi:NitT/TauT family transport system permease protein